MVVLLCSPKVASHVVIETFSIMCNLREVNSRSCKIACRLLAFFLRVCALCAFWPRALAEHATRASCSQFLHFQRFHPRVACTHVHATDTRLRPFGLRVHNFLLHFLRGSWFRPEPSAHSYPIAIGRSYELKRLVRPRNRLAQAVALHRFRACFASCTSQRSRPLPFGAKTHRDLDREFTRITSS